MKTIIRQFNKNIKNIKKYYDYLIKHIKKHLFIGINNELIINNYDLIEQYKKIVEKGTINNKVIDIVRNILTNHQFKVTYDTLISEINKYQHANNYFLTYEEIDAIKCSLAVITIETLANEIETERMILETINEIDNIISNIMNCYQKNCYAIINLEEFIKIDASILKNPTYIYYLNEKLNELGTVANDIVIKLNNILAKENISIKNLIKEEHDKMVYKNILFTNIFTLAKDFINVDKNELYTKISNTEKILNLDYIYPKMTNDTKEIYRKKIKKLAKNEPENKVALNIVRKSVLTKNHIGYTLFKQKSNTVKLAIYLPFIFAITFLLTSFLANFFLKNKFLSFLLLVIPVSEIVIKLVNNTLIHFKKTKHVFKMDLENIDNSPTIVVFNSNINDMNKLEKMFKKMEISYLSNKITHLYFVLLGNVCDAEIKNLGLEQAKKLNAKYQKNIFHFLSYNESSIPIDEKNKQHFVFMSFNQLLLNKECRVKDFFQNETISSIEDEIRYVITLNDNTCLNLNSVLTLVGVMLHPLNKPIIKKNRVYQGYALAAPKIEIDVSSSKYARYFGKLNSESYSLINQEFYQQFFLEGIFTGQGIYDLNIYESLLLNFNTSMENSLRCLFLNDVKLTMEAPSNYIEDKINVHFTPTKKFRNASFLGKWKFIDYIRFNIISLNLILIIGLSFFSDFNPYVLLFTLFVMFTSFWKFPFFTILLKIALLPSQAFCYLKKLLSLKEMHSLKNDFLSYVKIFGANYLAVVIILIIANKFLISALFMSILFFLPLFVLYFMGISKKKKKLSKRKEKELLTLACDTWKYFEDLLNAKSNYLICDNYQVNRDIKEDYRTSPTNIGMSLIAIISAYELNIIDLNKANDLLDKVITSVEKLEKWHGHLYNWYNNKTLEVLSPYNVSSVDSGNLVASLMVCKEFVTDEVKKRIENIITQTDFKVFYNDGLFSGLYNTKENKLSSFKYDMLASESRLLSYVAISKGDIKANHWFNLKRKVVKYKHHQGLISWNGTSFEYFMPLLFMKNYSNTLLDEAYRFSHFCQKSYMKEINYKLPWGISESAYNAYDDSNYKYCAFNTPYLKESKDSSNRIVLSPYSSLIALTMFPRDVYQNIKKFKKLNMYGQYGFYDAFDATDNECVLNFYAHHQGMILSSLANYLKDDVIKNYFYQDINVQAVDSLLKEKKSKNVSRTMSKYRNLNYQKDNIENDIRTLNYISDIPELSVLSNSKYSLLISDRGNGYSYCGNIQLNRYRKSTEQSYGIYLYIKNVDTGKVWSNTYAPTNVNPSCYEVNFKTDIIKYKRCDDDIMTQTEIIVTKKHNAEIRKYTFHNNSKLPCKLELTSYLEVIIEPNCDDISNRSFKNLFIKSSYDEVRNAIIMQRCESNNCNYLVNRLIVDNQKSTFETERFNFIGRNRTNENPIMLNTNLSNHVGTNLDPIISLRNEVSINPGECKTIYFINGFGKSMEQINDILDSYDTPGKICDAFTYGTVLNNVNTNKLCLNGYEMRNYNIMLNYLFQTSNVFMTKEYKEILSLNVLNEKALWHFGISGKYPIILVDINSVSSFSIVKELLKSYRYFKSRAIFVDLVIINSENDEYAKIIKNLIDTEIYYMNSSFDFINNYGNIYIIENKNLSYNEKILLNMVARMRFNTKDNSSLFEAVKEIVRNNKILTLKKSAVSSTNAIKLTENLSFFNEYGGFSSNGKEYIITNNNTKMPWANIITNETFGTIITNDFCGFTYAYNSQMFKLTSCTNDTVVNDKSEGIKINNEQINPTLVKHGFGYSIFRHQNCNYRDEITEFVAKTDNIKFFKIKLQNLQDYEANYDICYWLNPCLGASEENTSRFILTDFKDNCFTMRNVYSTDFSHITTFVTSTLPISSYTDDILVKELNVNISLKAHEEIEFAFILGATSNNISDLIIKYNDVKKVADELKCVKEYWQKELEIIQVNTPDESFNYMLNGWYLYQTLSSRLNAKASFYQVGGAFGFRDQLQDATNICIVDPKKTRLQILINACHQFREGDVLHWWHENNHFGLRTRYRDDYLWLVYAVYNYLDITKDYALLMEKVPFVEGEKLNSYECEKGLTFKYSRDEASVYEHCKRAIDFALDNIGENDLPLMGGGDWNDGMNEVGINGQGTSVWLGFFLYDLLDKFIKINLKLNKNNNKYLEALKRVHRGLDKTFENDYYLRAFYDNGDKLGANENSECKIDLMSQSFAILSNIAQNNADRVINAVEENLVDKELKIIKLLTPAFQNPKNNPGYIAYYPEGIRENGGQYTHSTAWYIMALLKCGYIDKAYYYYQMINPINRTKTKEEADIYQIEPYVISADIYSNEQYKGRGGYSWYTGSSGWFYKIGITDILGFKKHGEKLNINPKVPWDNFDIIYKYQSTTYEIHYEKTNTNEIIIDGKISKEIILKDDGLTHKIIVRKG